jgi:uroporphyrinogen decarboxylase
VLRRTGLTWRDIYFSPTEAAREMLTAHAMWGHDNVCSILSPICGIDDLGVKVNVTGMDEPSVDYRVPFLADEGDLDKLEVPDIRKGTMAKTVATAKLLRKHLGMGIPIVGGFGGLSTWAFFLRKADNFVRDFVKNRGFQEKYMEFITDVAIEFCTAQIRAGCDWIVSGEDAFAVDLFGPEESWVCNGVHARRLSKAIHNEGGRYIIHCCGDAELALNKMADTGADVISVDRVRLTYAKKALGSRVALMGNVKSTILLGKKPKDVEMDCKRAIGEARENGGYFLSCGYIYPAATPEENIRALIKSAATYGKY